MVVSNEIALVTGAGKGIGKAIAVGLARLNYTVILVGRKETDLQSVSDEIISAGYKTPVIEELDITNKKGIKTMISNIMADQGRIDVLVNNAGIYYGGSSETTEEEFSHMLDTNLTAQFTILREVIPIMKKQGSGYVFNVASRAGKIGFAGSGAYSASKFGLVGLSESLYRELTPLGISVTALCPGWVNTKMAFQAGSTLKGEEMIQPEDLAKTIKWLLDLSPGACVKEVVIETPRSIS